MTAANTASWQRKLSPIFLGFGALSLATAFVLSFAGSEQILRETVGPRGGTLGPFVIGEDNTVLTAKVNQRLPLGSWSFVTLALLNAQKEYLIGFGGEFWHEAGVGSEGYRWEQADDGYEASLTVPEDGRYYLDVKPENNLPPAAAKGNAITVTLTTRGFSTIPHFAAGIIAVLIGLLLSFIGKGSLFSMLKET